MSERVVAWILDRVALIAYERYLSEHGGRRASVDSVRLAAALALPRTVAAFSQPMRLSIVAAWHAKAILRLRPFSEGNEAMAYLLSRLFLEINGVDVPAPLLEKYAVFAGLADGRLGPNGYAQWIRMRHLAGKRGVQSVFEVTIRNNTIVRVAGVRSAKRSVAPPAALQGRARRPPAVPPVT